MATTVTVAKLSGYCLDVATVTMWLMLQLEHQLLHGRQQDNSSHGSCPV